MRNRVDAVDLAGPEAGYPATPFERMFQSARQQGLGITIHAGEAEGPANVWQAIEFGASRIGHGVRSVHDPKLVSGLAHGGITLECCPTCNVVTQAVPSLEQHPIDRFLDAGVAATISTDARTCLPTTLQQEIESVVTTFGWQRQRELEVQRAAARAAFTTLERRRELLELIDRAEGLSPGESGAREPSVPCSRC